VDADHHQPVGALVALDDLVRDPDKSPLHVGSVKHHEVAPFPASLDRPLKVARRRAW
jgi:hypothetical protein